MPEGAPAFQQAAEDFIAKNPAVWQSFCALALEALLSGKQRCSQRLLWERLRWDIYIRSSRPCREYRLNNNYVQAFAHKLLRDYPHLFPDDFFSFCSKPLPQGASRSPDPPPAH